MVIELDIMGIFSVGVLARWGSGEGGACFYRYTTSRLHKSTRSRVLVSGQPWTQLDLDLCALVMLLQHSIR